MSSRRPGAGIEVVGPQGRAVQTPWQWRCPGEPSVGTTGRSATSALIGLTPSRTSSSTSPVLSCPGFLFVIFGQLVRYIVAQPFFLLKAEVDGEVRRHVPDHLLLANQGSVMVDIEPGHQVLRPHSTFTFRLKRRAVGSKGWRNEVWNESPPAGLKNVRFLASFRRDRLFDPVYSRPDACLLEAS